MGSAMTHYLGGWDVKGVTNKSRLHIFTDMLGGYDAVNLSTVKKDQLDKIIFPVSEKPTVSPTRVPPTPTPCEDSDTVITLKKRNDRTKRNDWTCSSISNSKEELGWFCDNRRVKDHCPKLCGMCTA